MSLQNKTKPYSLIFDFDGVIADTYDIYIDFLVKKMKLSRKYATRKFKYTSTELSTEPSNWFWKLGSMWYYYRFYRYVRQQSQHQNLLFPDVLDHINSFAGPKAILTLAETRVCEVILKDTIEIFDCVIGRNNASYKPNGFRMIMETSEFQNTHPIFITDTVADIRNMLTILPKNQIFAVDWGFNDRDILEQYLEPDQIIRNDLSQFMNTFS